MVMTINKLKSELMGLDLYDNEPDAINAWSTAWKNYFLDAAANGIPVVPSIVDVGVVAMKPAMVGLSMTGAASLQAGIVAFWGALVPAAFATCITITPPPAITGIAAALLPVFYANVAGSLSKDACCLSVATVLHTNNLGGIAIFPALPTPLPFPIL